MEASIGKNKRISLFCFSAIGILSFIILVCCALVTIGVAIRPFMIIGFFVAASAIIFVKEEWQITAILFGLLNLANIFKLAPGSTSLFTYLEIIAVFKFFLIDFSFDAKFIYAWLGYIVYVFLGCGFDIIPFLKVAFVPLLLYLMIRRLTYRQLLYISCYYMLGVIIGSIIGLTKDIIPNMNTYVIHQDAFLGATSGIVTDARFSGVWGDPNYYSVHLLLSIAVSIIMVAKKEIKTFTFILLCVFFIIFGGMTGSKSFFFMLIALCAFFVVTLIKSKHFLLGSFVLLVGMVFIYLIRAGTVNVFSTVLARLQLNLSGEKDVTTGRSALWLMYFEGIISEPIKAILGNGIGKGYSFKMAPHNTYIDFIELVGIMGTSLFLFNVLKIYASANIIDTEQDGNGLQTLSQKKYIKNIDHNNFEKYSNCASQGERNFIKVINLSPNEYKIINFFPLITLCALYFFLSMFYSEDFAFELLLALSFIRIHRSAERTDRVDQDCKYIRVN